MIVDKKDVFNLYQGVVMYTRSLSPSLSPFHAMKRTLNHAERIEAHQNHQNGKTEPGGPRHVANDHFQRIVNDRLMNKLEKAIGMEGLSLNELNPDDFSPERVSERVLGFVNQALGRLQNSQPDFDKEAFFNQVKQGIDTGFKEARDILGELGVLGGQIEENIDATYVRIQEGLERLESGEQASVSTLALQSRSSELNKAVQIEVTTQEGDVITIDLEHTITKTISVIDEEQEGGSVSGLQSSFSSSSSFTVNIEGNLNEDEQASLKHLLKQMNKVRNAFFNGNLKAAFHHADKLGINSNTIAGVSMNLDVSRSSQAIAAYQQTLSPEQNVRPDSLRQVSEFLTQARERLQNARSALSSFENPLSAFRDMFAGVNQAGLTNVDEQESEASNRLMNRLIEPLVQSIVNGDQAAPMQFGS